MPPTRLEARLRAPGPKRLLSLDGGGVRGMISLGFLARIEAILRERYGRDDLVLADYFDLIGGTSTGSIIATGLCLGMSVERLRGIYLDLASDAFRPRKHWLGPVGRMLGAKFDDAPIEALARRELGNECLDSEELRCGLMVVTKRADTGSTWVIVNVPGHKYYEQNRHFRLWEIIRASTAAPTFFRPRMISDLGEGEQGIFVDGGVSMHVNPALQLLMVANLAGFGLQWPLGEDRVLLCSVGTGASAPQVTPAEMARYTNLQWAAQLATQFMRDSSELVQTLLQWLSNSPTAQEIDSQIGALEQDSVGAGPLISYLRYDFPLERETLSEMGLSYTEADVANLRDMSNPRGIRDLDRIGSAAGEQQIEPAHFPAGFDRS